MKKQLRPGAKSDRKSTQGQAEVDLSSLIVSEVIKMTTRIVIEMLLKRVLPIVVAALGGALLAGSPEMFGIFCGQG